MLDVEQAARCLGTPERFIRRLVAERRITFHKIGKYVRFAPEDLAAYIRDNRIEPVQPALTFRKGEHVYG
ncbi:helix-turn-helix domain-containing protein [Plantactinospora sp. B24E8]|uniref:helix-turn-helix domain-containing protein n=1 Tax=Plantactinospora sp. B24E8 TaxID=3153567 RepID=UPI00325F99FC